MIIPPRIRRHARDRALALIFATLFGLSLGVGGWYVWHLKGQKTDAPPLEMALQGPSSSRAAEKVALRPHKALYEVQLVSAKNGSQVIDIGGKMYFKTQDTCEGWSTDHRFVLTYHYADAAPMRMTSDFTTIESRDGTRFDFASRRHQDGDLFQELKGTAVLGGQNVPGRATYALPPDRAYDLPAGTFFPGQHTESLIRAARAGKKFVTATVFDGTDEDGPVEITALIGEKIAPSAGPSVVSAAAVDKRLVTAPAWKMRLAFFPLAGGSETSDYELTMVLHDNGVISNMTIEYPEFSVKQKLLALENVAPVPCMPAKAR